MEDAAALITDCRRRSGLTLRQLAARARTSHSAIAAYESGARSPNAATLWRLVAACGFQLQPRVRPIGPVRNRVHRGRELVEVLDLADSLPSERDGPITKRFPAS